MQRPDPLKTLKDELEHAQEKEDAWNHLLHGLCSSGANPRAIAEVQAQADAARVRRKRLLAHLQARTTATEAPPARAGYCLLVVDDHEASRYAMSRGLRALGFRTFEARNGSEALELASYSSALVLDVHLPDVHGFEVCRRLRARSDTAAKPIVHVSSIYVDGDDLRQGLAAGADAYLVAPADLRELASRLDRLLAAPG